MAVYRFLGKSGLKVSEICLGTMTFGALESGPAQCNEEQAHEILDKYMALGGNFIDTADVYTNGKSEEIVGSWLAKQQRDRFVIATKGRGAMGDHPNALGCSRVHMIQAVNDSLRRLQTDYIDLYQIHCWDDGVPIEETMGALNDLVTQGKIRYIGVSNFLGWQLQKTVDICKARGWHLPIALQQQYSLMVRQSELEVFDVCKNEGIGVMPWSPLKGGWLSGKLRRETGLESLDSGSRLAWASGAKGRATQSHPSYDQFNNEQTWALLDLMEDVGKKYGKSIAQVAIRWLLEKNVVSSVVIGAKNIKQLEDNMGASGGWRLTAEEVGQLDEASKYDIPYPYEMVFRLNTSRKRSS